MTKRALRAVILAAAVSLVLTASGAFAQSADVLITKTGPETSAADTDVAFTITVLNGGPDAATNVTLSDPIPGTMTFVSATQNSGPAFACTSPSPGSGGTISCTIATLAAGGSADFTFTFHIPPGTALGVFFTNIASVASDNDPTSENDSATATTSTPAPPTADLGITKSGPPNAGPDTDVVYVITLQNGGPDSATDAGFTDPLPGTMTFVSLVQGSGPALVCSTPAVGAGGTVTCTAATFPAGATASFTLTGHVPPGTGAGTFFANTASVTSATFDPNDENSSGFTGFGVSEVDLSVTKSGPATSAQNTSAAYTITVASAGPDIAQSVAVTDVLPPPTTFVSLVQDSGPAATCSTPAVGANGTVTCTFNLLDPGDSAQFTLTLNTRNAATIVNTATVSAASFDTNAANSSATATTAVAVTAVAVPVPTLSWHALALLGLALAAFAWRARRHRRGR
jgi:uncharacterized repeat protein (TIGR01451 family)